MTAARAFAAVLAVSLAAASASAIDGELRRLAKDPDALKRSDAARALAKDGSPEAARLLVDLFADESPDVRDRAVVACDDVTQADSVKSLAAAAKSKDELTRRNCADALGRTKCDAALVTLAHLASRDVSMRVRADALDAVGRFRGEAASEIARAGARDTDAFVRAAAIEAGSRIGGDNAEIVVFAGLSDPDDGVRCVARAALRTLSRAAALDGLADAAKDPSWRVRAQCVDDAAALRDAPAVDALVLLVGDKSTRVAAAAHRALQALSGKELGRDAALWSAWWNANRGGWTAPKGDIAQEASDDPKRTSANYHGVGVSTDAGVFVADVSGSMKTVFGGAETRTRWAVAAAELHRTIDSLPNSFALNLVFFQADLKTAFAKAQPLTKANREQAHAFVDGGSPGQQGDLLGAVLSALSDDGVDTLFVLSDGAPSAGDMVERSRVRAAVRQTNRMRKCVIDAIGFGAKKASERSLMEGLAHDSGGRAVFRGEGGK